VVCGEEVAGEFVISGGDAPPILDATEEVLDLVSASIDRFRAIGFFGRVAATGNGRNSAIVGDLLARLGAVIGLIGGDKQRGSRRVEDFGDDLAVMHLPAGEHKVQRSAFSIDAGMDFRAAPTAADADRLIFLPPFAPLDARWAFTKLLSIRCRLSRDLVAS